MTFLIKKGLTGPSGGNYIYVAYASSDTGANFSFDADQSLEYRAEIISNTPLDPPTETDFVGAEWIKYVGSNGTGVPVDVNLTENSPNAAQSGDVYNEVWEKARMGKIGNGTNVFSSDISSLLTSRAESYITSIRSTFGFSEDTEYYIAILRNNSGGNGFYIQVRKVSDDSIVLISDIVHNIPTNPKDRQSDTLIFSDSDHALEITVNWDNYFEIQFSDGGVDVTKINNAVFFSYSTKDLNNQLELSNSNILTNKELIDKRAVSVMSDVVILNTIYDPNTGELLSNSSFDTVTIAIDSDSNYEVTSEIPTNSVTFFNGVPSEDTRISRDYLGGDKVFTTPSSCKYIGLVMNGQDNEVDYNESYIGNSKSAVKRSELVAFSNDYSRSAELSGGIAIGYVYGNNGSGATNPSFDAYTGEVKEDTSYIIDTIKELHTTIVFYTGAPSGSNFLSYIESSKEFTTPLNCTHIAINFKTYDTVEAYELDYLYSKDNLVLGGQVSKISKKIEAINKAKRIICDGDSLTAGAGGTSYPTQLGELLGDGYEVIGNGIGGETSPTIAARQGGLPLKLTTDITIPTDSTLTEVTFTTVDDRIVNLLGQSDNGVNPVYIQGVEGTLSESAGGFFFSRSVDGIARDISVGEIIYTMAMRERREGIHIVHMGQNGGWVDASDLVSQFEAVADYLPLNNYIFITTHDNTSTQLEDLMLQKFKGRYFNSREYFATNAIYDAGLTPTQADLDAMALGNCPPSLLSDAIHFNTEGYGVLALQVKNKLTQLGLL